MERVLHRLIYCSRNAIPGDTAAAELQITRILRSAERHNTSAGITGALLFTHGCFVQALEGPRAKLEEAYERILCDERHRDITILAFEPVGDRAFPDWAMQYIDGPEHACCVSPAANDAFPRHRPGGDDVLALMRGVVQREREWASV